ncbi:glycosyltransferase family 2 protein [Bradyrhizobium septentrionale]|uniref:glycosyltransferase family 2 protein n=1 Tax=Bradyrhizobium septentrionale TaxID=1404411 RepID=UPI0030D3E17B
MLPQSQKIVILLATFNGAEHIAEQLESFAAQTHQNWELVVSDDGSTDRTVEIVREFGRSVPQRINIVEGPKKEFWQNFLSLVRRTNPSDAELFAFSDQDDIWLPEKLETAAKWFVTGASNVPRLYFTRTTLIEQDGKSAGLSPLFRRRPSFQNALVQNIGGGNTMVMNRTAALLLAQLPSNVTLISHDWCAYQVVTGAGGTAFYDSAPSLRYRQHGRNLIGSNRGVRRRIARARAFANHRVKFWNDINIAMLNAIRGSLSEPALSALDNFAAARRSFLLKRIVLLWRSGVYRQHLLETAGLYLGALFGLL